MAMDIATKYVKLAFGGAGGHEFSLNPDMMNRMFAVYQGEKGNYTSKKWEYKGNLNLKDTKITTDSSKKYLADNLVTKVEEKDVYGTYEETVQHSMGVWFELKVKGLFRGFADFDKADSVRLRAWGVKQQLLTEPAVLDDVELEFKYFHQDRRGRTVVFIVMERMTATEVEVCAIKDGKLVCGLELPTGPLPEIADADAGITWLNSSAIHLKAADPVNNPIILRRTYKRLAWEKDGQPIQRLQKIGKDEMGRDRCVEITDTPQEPEFDIDNWKYKSTPPPKEEEEDADLDYHVYDIWDFGGDAESADDANKDVAMGESVNA